MSLITEIHEQGDILERLLNNQMGKVEEVARLIKKHNPPYIFLAARGTSDNAGRYANYVLVRSTASPWPWRPPLCSRSITNRRSSTAPW